MLVIAAALCLAALSTSASAAPGDIYVADQALTGTGAIFRVDASTGERTLLASGPPLSHPTDVTFAPDGDLLVADPGAKALLRVDPATGAASVAVSGGKLEQPWGVVATRSNRAYVTDLGASGAAGNLFRVNPQSGAKSPLNAGPLADPTWLALDRNGSVLVADGASVIRVDPGSGATAPLFETAHLGHPAGVAVDAGTGLVFIVDQGPPATLFRFDPRAGFPTPIAFDPPGTSPADIALEPSGNLVYADPDSGSGAAGALVRVDWKTGARNVLAAGAPFTDPVGVAVSPPTCRGKPVTIVGSPGNDRLVGSTSAGTPDVIAALGGDDRIKGNNGSDVICGGDGNDRVNGGKGKDSISGDAGADRLGGSAGKDSLDGGSGRDSCDGGSGTDSAKGCEKPKRVP
jgi:Ca2+-binding RTX toxin-like protein